MLLTAGGEPFVSEVKWLLLFGVLERDWNFFNFERCGMLIYSVRQYGKRACLFARNSDLLTSIHDNRSPKNFLFISNNFFRHVMKQYTAQL